MYILLFMFQFLLLKDFDFDALESSTSYEGGFNRTHPVIK